MLGLRQEKACRNAGASPRRHRTPPSSSPVSELDSFPCVEVTSSFPVQIQAWFEREHEKWLSPLELLPVENMKLLPTVGAAQLPDPPVSAPLVLLADALGSGSAVRKDNS